MEMLRMVTGYSRTDFSRRMSCMGSQEMANMRVTTVTSFTTLLLLFTLSRLTAMAPGV